MKRPTSGARESNAGDDFHFLWASRRVVALLDPAVGPTRVRIEGLTELDDPDSSDDYLGADLVEYYGGHDFKSSDSVVISQLKYSVRNPNTAWSAARLAAGSGHESVIRKLARIYARLIAERSEEHTSELQSHSFISYAVFCLKKKNKYNINTHTS